MENMLMIGVFLLFLGTIFLFFGFIDRAFIIFGTISAIIGAILIGIVISYSKKIEQQFDEILSRNESIIIIETKTNNDDILRKVINNYDNYEPIYEDFENEGETKIILVKPLEMRFIKKDLFEREFKTTIDDEKFWEEQKQKQIKNNIENGSKYYLDDEVIFKQFIQG